LFTQIAIDALVELGGSVANMNFGENLPEERLPLPHATVQITVIPFRQKGESVSESGGNPRKLFLCICYQSKEATVKTTK